MKRKKEGKKKEAVIKIRNRDVNTVKYSTDVNRHERYHSAASFIVIVMRF